MTAPTETPLTDLEVEREAEAYERCLEMLAGLRATRRANVLARLGTYFGETPSLTTEQAQAYAACWAETEGRARGERDSSVEFDTALDEAEREQLFAWVRARMAESPATSKMGKCWAVLKALPADLAMSESQAWELCKAAGWPS